LWAGPQARFTLGTVEPTNNGSAWLLRPAVVQRKMTNGYRAIWAAAGDADIRTIVDSAQLAGSRPFATIFRTVSV
jgi:transposase